MAEQVKAFGIYFSLLSIAGLKHHDQKQLGGVKNLSGLQVIVRHWGRPRQELDAGHEVETMGEYCLLAWSACYTAQNHLLGGGAACSVRGPPPLHSPLIKPTGQFDGANSLTEVPSSQMTLIRVKLTKSYPTQCANIKTWIQISRIT